MDPLCPLSHLADSARLGNRLAEDAFAQEAWRRSVRIAEDRLRGNRLRRFIDPEDIAQNVVLTVCTRILRKAGQSPIGNWNAMLRMLTEHAIVDAARSLGKELTRVHSMSSCQPETVDCVCNVAERSGASRWEDVEQRCQEIESRLPTDFQKVWCMRREGISWSEIGATHGCNGHALRVRFNAWLRKVATKKSEGARR
ncbi:MAG: hypothetical protein ACK5OB_15610 [Pirellula sp.]